MDTKETKFYNLFDVIGLEFKKHISKVPESLEVELSLRDLQILEFIGLELKTMSEITEILDITAGTLTIIIDNLVSKKILKRERNEKVDRRKVFISLDSKGKIIHNKIREVQKIAVNSMLKGLNNIEVEEAYIVMKKMYEGLKNHKIQ